MWAAGGGRRAKKKAPKPFSLVLLLAAAAPLGSPFSWSAVVWRRKRVTRSQEVIYKGSCVGDQCAEPAEERFQFCP